MKALFSRLSTLNTEEITSPLSTSTSSKGATTMSPSYRDTRDDAKSTSKWNPSAEPATDWKSNKPHSGAGRGSKVEPAIEMTSIANGGMRTEYLSLFTQAKINDDLTSETPLQHIHAQKSSTMDAVKISEVPPAVPPKADVKDSSRSIPHHPLSAPAQRSVQKPLTERDDLTRAIKEVNESVTANRHPVYDSVRQSGPNLHYLEPPSNKLTTKSLPTTPWLTPNEEHMPVSTRTKVEAAPSFKSSLSKRNRSKKEEQKGKEKGLLGPQIYQPPRYPVQMSKAGPNREGGFIPDLASELNELAVAHNEGLLGEEEYRMLRQAVFDRMAKKGQMELPRETPLQGISKQNEGVRTKVDALSVLSGSSSMRSKSSSTSKIASLFKRDAKNDSKTHAGSSSLLSTGESSHSGTAAPSRQSRMSNSTAMESQIAQARRARSLHGGSSVHRKETPFPSSSSSSSSPSGKSRPEMLSIGQGGGRSLYAVSGASISTGNALLGANYSEKKANEIEAEIAVVEAEGKRMLENFKSLQLNALNRCNLSLAMLKQAVQGIETEIDLESEIFEDYIVMEKGREQRGDTDIYDIHGHSEGAADTSGTILRRKRSFGMKKSAARVPAATTRRNTINAKQQSAKISIAAPESTGQYLYTKSEEEDPDITKLRVELKDIVMRRSQVAKKYADRIAFLRSTLRSAKIRQGLK